MLASHQQGGNPAIHRRLPPVPRSVPLARPVYVRAISQRKASKGQSLARRAARSASREIVFPADSQNYSFVRPRLGGSDRIWQASVCPSWLQSEESGQTILPSPSLLRGPLAGVLTRISESRGRRCQYGSRTIPQALSRKGSEADGPLSGPYSGRFRILWQKDRRVPRFWWLRLRYCGKGMPSHQIARTGMSIQGARKRIRGRRVPIQTAQVEKATPVCRGASSYSNRSCRSAAPDALRGEKERLPCCGHQSESRCFCSPRTSFTGSSASVCQGNIFRRRWVLFAPTRLSSVRRNVHARDITKG